MVTVSNPSGTPSIAYNRSGTTIVDVTAAGTTLAAATPIPSDSVVTVAVVTTAASNIAVSLPADADVGDIIEVCNIHGGQSQIYVFPDSSSTWVLYSTGDSQYAFACEYSAVFRKIASTVWAVISNSTSIP